MNRLPLAPALLALVLLAFNATPAAAASSTSTRYGLEVGFNVGNAATAPDSTAATQTQSTHLGFTGGLYADHELTTLFYFTPELLYLQKGASFGAVTVNLNTLDVPLLLKAKLDFGHVKPFVFTGPDLGILLSATSSSGNVSVSATNFNTFDLAWNFGGGLEYELSSDLAVQANLRYATGLVDVDGTPARWYSRDVTVLFGASVTF